MLTISDTAADTIHTMLRVPGVPPEAGVRVQYAPDHQRLSVRPVSRPGDGDIKYDAGDGTSLYVAAEVADRVHDKLLDAGTNEKGYMQFVLSRPEH